MSSPFQHNEMFQCRLARLGFDEGGCNQLIGHSLQVRDIVLCLSLSLQFTFLADLCIRNISQKPTKLQPHLQKFSFDYLYEYNLRYLNCYVISVPVTGLNYPQFHLPFHPVWAFKMRDQLGLGSTFIILEFII